MSQRTKANKHMIMDACVLIDFIKADHMVFKLIAKNVGPICVITPIVEEVDNIDDESELLKLGLVVIEPEFEDADLAVSFSGSTSFNDRLCMLTAKRYGFKCITNDKSLRKLCQQEKVPVVWGLELLLKLHRAGGIHGEKAIEIAEAIHKTNPKHITHKIILGFKNKFLNNLFGYINKPIRSVK